MGAQTETHVVSRGRLIRNPSNLSLPPLYGGTQLGTVQFLRLTITRRIDPITAEEYGSETIDGVLLGTDVVITGLFSGWDEDLIAATGYNAAVGSGTVPTLSFPETGVYVEESGKQCSLLWASDDDTVTPSWIAYNAVPWGVVRPLYFGGRTPMQWEASWLCTRDASDRVLTSALLADLTL